MPEWLKISLGGAILFWFIREVIRFYWSEKRIRRRAMICREAGVSEFAETHWLLVSRTLRIVLNPYFVRTQPVQPAAKPAERVEPEEAKPRPETREEAVAKLLREMLIFPIPHWPESAFGMPKYIELIVLGKREIYELVPLKATTAGQWYFAYDEKLVEAGAKSKKPVKVPLGFWSFIIQKQRIGTVVSKTSIFGKKRIHHLSTKSGFIVSMQVQNGIKVEEGDVVCILACRTDLAPVVEEKAIAAPIVDGQ